MAQKKYDDLRKEELVRLLETRDRRDATRFGLVWEANEIERDKNLNQDFVTLDLDPELSCPKNADGWKNLIIEGDNFDALRYLRMTFAGRVKCIYIDPPYNTGNKDFVYNDHFVDKEDLWRHSKWCEFMFQRLTLAKDLLRQDGVIFVSIDDNEMFHLGLLMSRIFGYGNFVANIVWQKRTSPDMRLDFSTAHEYVVTFSRSNSVRFKKTPKTPKQIAQYKNPDGDPRGPWVSSDYTAQGFRPNQMYKITTPGGVVFEPPTGVCWKNIESGYLELVKDNRIWFGRDGKSMPRKKTFLSESEGNPLWTWWSNEETGHNQEAKKELDGILGEDQPFDTPKPSRLVERMVAAVTEKGDLILDFFAGSGTTAHAVHKLNQEDGGNRRVILVSSTEATVDEPDKNLCRDVCATRVRRVIDGYGDTPGLGGDFAYLRCRRIAPGKLIDINHTQVWTALQLTHMPTLSALDEKKPFVVADHDNQRLIYVPHFRAKDGRALSKAVGGSPATIVYTWQPDLVKARLRNTNNVQVEAVPESLVRRFGMRI